jgi:hypothetical protein
LRAAPGPLLAAHNKGIVMNARTFRTGGLLAAGSLLTAAAMAGTVQLDTNLLSNGGAEKGLGSTDGNTVVDVPKWTTEGNFTVIVYGAPEFPSMDSPGPKKRGHQFFAGGPGNGLSSANRTLNLKPLAADIDAGTVQGTLADHADLTVTFLDAAGAELGSIALPTVTAADRGNATGLLKRKVVGDVPVGARSARVALVMTRLAGSYNDGYADSLSLVLTKKP